MEKHLAFSSSIKKYTLVLFILPLVSLKYDGRTTSMIYGDQQEILKGRVKRLIQTGLSLRGSPFWFEYTDTLLFNKKGEQTTEKSGWNDGLHSRIDYNFSGENGRKSLELPWPRAIGKREYEFDAQGQLTQASFYNEYGFFEKNIYCYNTFGQLIEVTTYNQKGIVWLDYQLSYKNGLLVKEGRSSYKYLNFDKHGNWIKRVRVEKDSQNNTVDDSDTVTRKIIYY